MTTLRTISEQELKNILDKHDKFLKGLEGGEKADLNSANLRFANLSFANLSFADLRSADLRSANLRFANLNSADLRSANLNSADLSFANLSFANLNSANLNSANLNSADLRSANLRFANLNSADLVTFQFQRHTAYYTFDGTLRIGCHVLPISEWAETFEQIGQQNDYSEIQIKMYGNFIKSCLELFNEMNPK
ncbi:MAG TPA: pentapeptide repeat-containing protein [Fervidobacterium sp.]|nr:pentapeptide repeat-containing protein [Fervidobacterium sp.]